MDSEAVQTARGDGERIEEAAARWFARKQSRALTQAEEVSFGAWIEASVAHRIAYLRAETAWNQAARMRALGAGVPAGVIPPRGSWGDSRFFRGLSPEVRPPPGLGESVETPIAASPRRSKTRLLAIAASVLLVVALGVVWRLQGVGSDSYGTPVGGLNTVPLADGSQVVLNTDSRIRVSLSESERRVELDRGEAFFDVARDTHRPFVVHAGDRRIVVLGTKFSVRRDVDDLQVIVTEGRVRLESGKAGSAEPPTQLDAGAVARTAKAAVIVEKRPPPDVTRLLSWRSGYVIFRDTELSRAVAEFNRYSAKKIVIEDPSIADIRIGGNFRTNNAEAFLWLVQTGFPVKVEEKDGRVLLTSR